MFPTNWYIYFLVAFIPLLIGAIYYSPKVAGNAWMKTNGFTEESLEGANMPLIFGLSYLFGLFITLTMVGIAIHQGGVAQTMLPDIFVSGSEAQNTFNDLMTQYGDRYRSWGHGALHGFFFALFFVFPVIAINALFERRGWKYIFIHTGYWTICLTIMAAILCQTLIWAPMI